jgi:hypothetical protein
MPTENNTSRRLHLPLMDHETSGQNMRPAEAAGYLRVSESTLAKLRMRTNRAKGPKFGRLGGCVIYRKSDLDAWVESGISSACNNREGGV